MGNSGGGGGHVHHHHVVYAPDPAIELAKKAAELKAKQLREQAEISRKAAEATKIKEKQLALNLQNNLQIAFDKRLRDIGKMKLTDGILKKAGTRHVSFIGPISSGKTTLQNVMFDLSNPVALGDCTNDCTVVYNTRGLVVWDISGDNKSFRYVNEKTLKFIKGLDVCAVLFDSDIAAVSWTIKIVYAINPNALVIVRTKVDQHSEICSRTIDEEKIEDGKKVQKLLGLPRSYPTYCVSAHSVREDGARHDYDTLRRLLTK